MDEEIMLMLIQIPQLLNEKRYLANENDIPHMQKGRMAYQEKDDSMYAFFLLVKQNPF